MYESSLIPRLRFTCYAAMLGNSFFLVKARLQAYSPSHVIGKASHNYAGTWDGLRHIVREEGVRGLARGMDAAVLRTAMGSTVSVPCYNVSMNACRPR